MGETSDNEGGGLGNRQKVLRAVANRTHQDCPKGGKTSRNFRGGTKMKGGGSRKVMAKEKKNHRHTVKIYVKKKRAHRRPWRARAQTVMGGA